MNGRKRPSQKAQGSSPLRRIASVLDELAAAPDGLPLNELARRQSLPLASAHRAIRNLAAIGYVEGSGHAPYRLGRRLLRLSQMAVRPDAIATLVEPTLASVAERLQVTCFLKRLTGPKALLVATVMPRRPQRSAVQPGDQYPISVTASGRAILAWQTPQDRDAILAVTPPVKGLSRKALDRILDEALAKGYAMMDNELDPGVAGIAVPINIEGTGVTFALGVTGFRDTLIPAEARQRVINALTEASVQLARLLSHSRER